MGDIVRDLREIGLDVWYFKRGLEKNNCVKLMDRLRKMFFILFNIFIWLIFFKLWGYSWDCIFNFILEEIIVEIN